jgi:hypothetical protein
MTTNLLNPVWIPIGGATTGNSMQLPTTNSAGFYRVLGQ